MKRIMKRELNLVTAQRELMIVIYHEIHRPLYTLMMCQQCSTTACVCCKYHRSASMTCPISRSSRGVSFIDMYRLILHATVRLVECYEDIYDSAGLRSDYTTASCSLTSPFIQEGV